MIPMPIQRRDFVTYILLSIITCGIYPIFFWYRFAQDINRVCEGDGDTTTDYIIAWLLSIVMRHLRLLLVLQARQPYVQ